MNLNWGLSEPAGVRDKQDKGYIFPVTLVLSVIISSFLLHQVENYRLEKMFYHESDQQFELEVMMKYTWDIVEEQLKEEREEIISSVEMPRGEATVTVKELGTESELVIVCTTRTGREYKATILYDMEEKKVLGWYETIKLIT
ncbi:competence type IV pilus minor pilin ComGG [Sutcliffiella horikoshii]|uniref:competence type IV pilus minor pilin ComGG n=1 Tax=Sutcliffiella horikoshii TaxID=79883 RepID=UPI001CFCCD7B|nr:competence type IV pilus minor pilin ComGG [Sutcliffiella horikoshii]